MNQKLFYVQFIYFFQLICTIIIYPILLVVAVVYKIFKYINNCLNAKNIAGQVAVITGSGRGLGREFAIELAKRGCHIAIVDIQGKLAQETAKYIAEKYKVKTKAYKIDVCDYYQLVELRNSVTTDLGDVTILINNAAILSLSSLKNAPPEEIQQMINVNLIAICYTHQIFLPKMKELNNGHIVNISSTSALLPYPFFDIYAATKAAVRSLTSSLRIEIMNEHKNITATTVMPTFLSTNKRVEKMTMVAGIHSRLPLVEGNIVAQYVVNGMLRGARELTVPSTILNTYKLLEFLPVCAKEIFLSVLVMGDYNKIMNSTEIDDILKTTDIIV